MFFGQSGIGNWTMHVEPPSCETTVTGFSSETSAGHAVLNGGGGLHVAFGWHSTLIAAMQPSWALKTVHARSPCGVVTGGVVVTGGGVGCGWGGGCCGGGC